MRGFGYMDKSTGKIGYVVYDYGIWQLVETGYKSFKEMGRVAI